jgi:hypothetical protein
MAGNIDSDQIKPSDKQGTGSLIQMAAGSFTPGDVLVYDANGNAIDGGPPGGGGGGTGTGTVTSVGLTMPAEFIVSGSPVTGAGVLAVTKANVSAHQVYAGPTSGSAAPLTARLLVAADIPAIPESGVTNLVTDLAAKAPAARLLNTTAPLTGGGDLSVDRTLGVSVMTGDGGTGGASGVVPAPGAGDAAAGKFLKADGTWTAVSGGSGSGGGGGLLIGFGLQDGSPGTNVGPMLAAPAAGTLTKCVAVVKTSDGATAINFNIKKNGSSVFATTPTIAAGAAAGAVVTFTSLAGGSVSVAAGDVFSIDIGTGSSQWNFTAQLEP